MTVQHVSILEKFAADAIRLGAERLEVEYKGGFEELLAIAGDFGFGIGRLRSASRDAATQRHELYQCTRRKRQIVVDGDKYELHGRTYDNVGEQAYRCNCAATEDRRAVSGPLQHAQFKGTD